MTRPHRITTAWCVQLDENPWLLDAYDEWSEEAWGRVPDHFTEAVEKARKNGNEVRIVDVVIDYDAVTERFAAKAVVAKVAPSS